MSFVGDISNKNYDIIISSFQNTVFSRRPEVANTADIISMAITFIKASFKKSKEPQIQFFIIKY